MELVQLLWEYVKNGNENKVMKSEIEVIYILEVTESPHPHTPIPQNH